MREITNASLLTVDSSKRLCYEGKKIGSWWGKTLYHFDPKQNKLYCENFSFLGLLFRACGYKKRFNDADLSQWLKANLNPSSPSSSKVSKVAIGKLLSFVDQGERKKIKEYRMLLHKHPVSEDALIAFIESKGIDVNALVREDVNETLLIEACVNRRFKLAKYLIEKGAEVNEKANERYGTVSNSALHGAISMKNKEIAFLLLEKGASLEQGNTYGETPLLAAIGALEYGTTPGWTIVGQGTHEDGVDIIKALLKRGAKVNEKLSLQYGHGTWRPLGKAIRLKGAEALEMAKLLVDHGASVDPEGEGRKYVLSAIYGNKMPIVEFLLDKGVDLTKPQEKDSGEETPLLAAISKFQGDKEKLIRLLSQKGADVNEKGGYLEKTPLHLAATNGDLKTVKLLIELGADKEIKDANGGTAAVRAREQGHQEIADILEKP